LKQLLPKRPELKVIVTSATLDAERFSKHFDGAPVIEVSGRLYPIEPPHSGQTKPRGQRQAKSACSHCSAVPYLSMNSRKPMLR